MCNNKNNNNNYNNNYHRSAKFWVPKIVLHVVPFFNSNFSADFKNAIHFNSSHQDILLQHDQILRNFEVHS